MMNDSFFMEKALHEARTALADREFPVGCVIADKTGVIATGARQGSSGRMINEVDHAEMVALKKLSTISGIENKKELTLFCTLEPCLMCFGGILLSGIGRIVYAYEDVMGGGTGCDLFVLPHLYHTFGILIEPHVLRKKSLDLFKQYFSNPNNSYWQGSMLAEYTLRQV